MFRRLVALTLCILVTASSAEAVFGAVRDGAVHHENTATAAAHAEQSPGDHHHDDGSPHGPEHRHGTMADHCTHHHGTPVTTAQTALPPLTGLTSVPLSLTSIWSDRSLERLLRPPRA